MFAPIAARYRACGKLAFFAFMGMIGSLAVIAIFRTSNPALAGTGVLAAIVCTVALFVIILITPKLTCPACKRSMTKDKDFGNYCPECGASQLKSKGWMESPQCDSCKATIWTAKSRHYRIRNCTHCGARVDEAGL